MTDPIDPTEVLAAAARDPFGTLRAWKSRTDRLAVGTVCTYVPEELLHAAGILPARIIGSAHGTGPEGYRFPTMSCAFSRFFMDQASRGDLDALDGMVFPHTCDTVRSLADILAVRMPEMEVFHFNNPMKTDGHAQQFTLTEMKKLSDWIGERFGRVAGEGAVRDSIRIYNENRKLMRALYAMRREGRQGVTSGLIMTAVLAASVMPREEHTRLLGALVEAERPVKPVDPGKSPVVLVGNICSSAGLFEDLERLDLRIVDDDLCTGSLPFADDVDEVGDPFRALAKRYTERVPCPIRLGPEGARADRIVRMVRRGGARSVIFLLMKFCDPHGFELPLIKKTLDAEGIPSIVVEHEGEGEISGQTRTRIEAFIEMVEG